MRNMPVLKYFVSSTEHKGILVELSPCSKLPVPNAKLVIWIVANEIHSFFIERFLLKLWPLGEGLTLRGLNVLLLPLMRDNMAV